MDESARQADRTMLFADDLMLEIRRLVETQKMSPIEAVGALMLVIGRVVRHSTVDAQMVKDKLIRLLDVESECRHHDA